MSKKYKEIGDNNNIKDFVIRQIIKSERDINMGLNMAPNAIPGTANEGGTDYNCISIVA